MRTTTPTQTLSSAPRGSRHLLPRLMSAGVLVGACVLALQPYSRAQAATNTVSIVTNTLTALPSCSSYQVKGMCFFLRCGISGCRIRTSVRIAHYVPDVIISTYNDPVRHPWSEVGKPLATALASVGSAVLGAPIDSSASTQRDSAEITAFKSADAIANPAGMIAQIASTGQVPNFGNTFSFPGYNELLSFPRSELPRIANEWKKVPVQLGNEMLEAARKMVQMPSEIISAISTFPSTISRLNSGMGKLSNLYGGASRVRDMTGIGLKVVNLTGINLGPVQDLMQIARGLGASGGVSRMFCPGSSSAFTLHYQSDMDALFWRDAVSVELMYPQAWVPGLGEVSQSPSVSTWGSVYPRTGQTVQQHPVKASAVLATRVASIITQSSQPHIYKRLEKGSGYRYFSTKKPTTWQMLYPRAERSCKTFGSNDSLSLSSFGDNKTDSADSYMWNMWNHYECCRRRGSYLFSVP